MTSLALTLRIDGWRCVVVGGGPVAARKVRTLLEACGSVTVIAPAVVASIEQLAADGRVALHRRPFAIGDCDGARVVVAATDDADVNELVGSEAARAHALVNRADDADAGDVALGAVARVGAVLVMIATEGVNPAAARWLRDHIVTTMTPTIERLGTALTTDDRDRTRRSYADIVKLMATESDPHS